MNEIFLERVRCRNHPKRKAVARAYSEGGMIYGQFLHGQLGSKVTRYHLCEECLQRFKKKPNHVEIVQGRRVR